MKWVFIRTIIYIVIAVCAWSASQFYIAQDLKNQMYHTPQNAIFVDGSPENSPRNIASLYDARYSSIQKKLLQKFAPIERAYIGTPLFPLKTIGSALEVAQGTDIDLIYVTDAIYEESLSLPENITLLGGGEALIHSDAHSKYTIRTNNNTRLVNITISGGNHSAVIPYNTSAVFNSVTFSDANDYGVLMEDKERITETPDGEEILIYEYYDKTEEELASMPLVVFDNCTVTRNGNQGMYLRDGRVLIQNSRVIENGEEGIDLHPHMQAWIINTESSHNGESGFESEIYDNIISIENSTFNNNVKNGIAFITSHGTGSALVKDSIITNNQQYGIRCAIHKNTPDYPRPFFQTVVTRENNILENNAMRYASDCFAF